MEVATPRSRVELGVAREQISAAVLHVRPVDQPGRSEADVVRCDVAGSGQAVAVDQVVLEALVEDVVIDGVVARRAADADVLAGVEHRVVGDRDVLGPVRRADRWGAELDVPTVRGVEQDVVVDRTRTGREAAVHIDVVILVRRVRRIRVVDAVPCDPPVRRVRSDEDPGKAVGAPDLGILEGPVGAAIELEHVLRGHNREADELANQAMDKGSGRASAPAPAKIGTLQEFDGIVRNGKIELLDGNLPEGASVQVRIKPR